MLYMLNILSLELFHMQPPKDSEVRVVLTGCAVGKSHQWFAYVNSILKGAIRRISLVIDSYEI